MDNLEKLYGVKSVENAKKRADEITEQERKVLNDRIDNNKKNYDALINAINKTTNSSVNDEDITNANKKTELPNKQFLNEVARKKALEDLERKHQAKILQIQLADIASKIAITESFHENGKISEETYNEQIEKLNKELADNTVAIAQNNLDTIQDGWEQFQTSLNKIVSAIEAVNQQIIKPLFDLQRLKLDNAQEQTEKEQDAQKEQELNLATSEKQKDEIKKKYDEKKRHQIKSTGNNEKTCVKRTCCRFGSCCR